MTELKPKFEVGDKVRYVRKGKMSYENRDWAKEAGCRLGETYVIKEINAGHRSSNFKPIKVMIEGSDRVIHQDHFERACKLNRARK